MKTIIAGSREIQFFDEERIFETLDSLKGVISHVLSGHAIGVDRIGERWARENNIPIDTYIPDWKLGKGAGMKRNKDMAHDAIQLIAFWDGKSTGTKNMIEEAMKCRLIVHLYYL